MARFLLFVTLIVTTIVSGATCDFEHIWVLSSDIFIGSTTIFITHVCCQLLSIPTHSNCRFTNVFSKSVLGLKPCDNFNGIYLVHYL